MFTQKFILLFCILVITGTSCASTARPVARTPTTQPVPIDAPIQHQPISTLFIGVPLTSNPLIQGKNESVDEFVARIAARDISYSHPVLILLSRLKVKSTVLFGVPSGRQDVQQCWLYETDSGRACTNDDLKEYFSDLTIPKIFFAFVYSTSEKSLFLIEHFYNWDEYYSTESFRLVLELKDGKWVERSLMTVY
jgi:hypothetical protein